jgi:ABC-2 type transport system permease protein
MNLRPSGGWMQNRELGDWLLLSNGLVLAILINLLASSFFFRVDLTEEKRFTIKEPTKKLLRDLDDEVFIEVFLEGDLNPGFRRFKKSIREILEEFRIYSGNKVSYTFTDPGLALGEKAKNEFMAGLAAKGIQGLRVIDTKSGERVEKIVFPGALVNYNGFEQGVMLLKGNRSQGSENVLNQSVEGVEFELANAIHKLAGASPRKIGFISGHGELDSLQLAGWVNELIGQYNVVRVDLSKKKKLDGYDVLVLAKPTRAFSEADKFKIDQFVMQGGRMLLLLDGMDASMDSAARGPYYAIPYSLNLDDMLFKYGVRIEPGLVQDHVSGKYPVVIGEMGAQPQIIPMDWPFYPLITNYANHPITRNLDATLTRFVSKLDTVKAIGIKRTGLLFTSAYSRIMAPPVKIDMDDLRKQNKRDQFGEGVIPIAYLMEGSFTSLYKNRFLPEGFDAVDFRDGGLPSKIIVMGDGDLARNEINPHTRKPLALGFDPVTGYTFANEDLLMNSISFLLEENGLISLRNKEVKIRPLDKEKIRNERIWWQVLNLAVPLGALITFGLIRTAWRKRKYSRF